MQSARFQKPRWNRYPHALARDDRGAYYYVDHSMNADDRSFHLFVGMRGSMKPMKMKNVVSDSDGEIFSTNRGELRLVLNKDEAWWVNAKVKTTLHLLPVHRNIAMIFNDLGVYIGLPLGTPCDDL